MKKFIFSIINLFILFGLNSEEFVFKFQKGQKFKITCSITGTHTINGVKMVETNQQYKTIRHIKDVKDNIAEIEDDSYYYNQNTTLINNDIIELSHTLLVNYFKDSQGRMIVQKQSIFPTIRNVPIFPEKNVEVGDSWEFPAVEVQDIFNDNSISVFPVNTYYKFVGYEEINGQKLAKIYYYYNLNQRNNFDGTIDKRILQITGTSKTMMYFDNKLGTRVKEIYERDYSIVIMNGGYSSDVRIVDNGERIWHLIEKMDKDKIIDDIKKDLKDNKVEETEIQKDDKGVKITLENIQFDPDSSVLRKSEIERLNKISKIVEKFGDKGVLIVGHTTDRGTSEGRKRLSFDRAKSVADFLHKKTLLDKSKLFYYGKGGDEPIADNKTIEGMKKNRRVEIYLLEE